MNTLPIRYLSTCIALISISLLFYANFRSETFVGLQLGLLQISTLTSIQLPIFISHSTPSILQALILGLCLRIIWNRKALSSIKLSGLTLSIATAFEFLQLTPLLAGYYDWLDIFGLIIAAAFIYLIDSINSPLSLKLKRPVKIFFSISLISGAYITSAGSGELKPTPVTPITLTWEELRADINPVYGNETALTRPGKIYKKDHYLYIVDQYRGFHIFDISDESSPIQIVFVPIIGALDISINNDHAYINSFNDLVTIDTTSLLDSSFDQTKANRTEYVFEPHDYWDFFVGDYYSLEGASGKYSDFTHSQYSYPRTAPEKGIIIGFYHPDGREILFGEL